jgi:RNA polymerase sigma factor (sigma-70 family)
VVSPAAEPQLEAVERLRLGLQIMALRALGDPDAAEEAVQETLVRTLEALRKGRLRDPQKLGAFARGIARHVIADALSARRRQVPLQAVSQTKRSSGSDNPLSTLISTEERDRVRQALTQLSARDREILHLAFFEGLTPIEIAERSGEPALRIRKRKSRALRRLREAFRKGAGTCHESRSSETEK